jgi:hypothetical protein
MNGSPCWQSSAIREYGGVKGDLVAGNGEGVPPLRWWLDITASKFYDWKSLQNGSKTHEL